VTELAREEQELSHYFKADEQHGLWSQYDASEAAQKLQTLLDNSGHSGEMICCEQKEPN